ncbi:hypothetical protein JOQ06_028014, partial [Pogonophryne albipinna]
SVQWGQGSGEFSCWDVRETQYLLNQDTKQQNHHLGLQPPSANQRQGQGHMVSVTWAEMSLFMWTDSSLQESLKSPRSPVCPQTERLSSRPHKDTST